MASGSITFGLSDVYQGRMTWSSQHQSGNNSYVLCALHVRTLDGIAHNSTISCSIMDLEHSGSEGGGGFNAVIGASWVQVFNAAFIVPYDDYGSAKASFYASLLVVNNYNGTKHAGAGNTGVITVATIEKYAYISSAQNFNDTDNPTIKYSNSWNAKNVQVAISLDGTTDDIAYRPASGGEYTFALNDEERNLLINAVKTGGSREVRFWIKSTINSSTSKREKKVIFNLIDYEPTLNPVVVDMNDKTYDLTGDYNKFVKGYSRAAVQTHAEAHKNATITEYYFEHNGITRKEKSDLASFIEIEVPLFIFGATDSRGNTARAEKTVEIVDYFKPWCEISADYQLATETTMDIVLNITGTGWNQNFGLKHNAFKLEWRMTDVDGRWSEWQNATDDARFEFNKNKPNEFSFHTDITEARYDKTYSFQARITDALDTYTSEIFKRKLLPVFDWSENDFNVNVPFNMNGETVLRHNITANNTVLSASGGFIYFRPQGTNSTSGEIKFTPQGNIEITGDIIINGKSLKTLLGI